MARDNTMPQADFNEAETSLNFKEHRLFFEKFFELRTAYIISSNDLYTDLKSKNVITTIGALIALIDWTSSHLSKKLNVPDLKKEIIELGSLSDIRKVYIELDRIFQLISNAHEETELLPKINIVQEDYKVKFWKEEDNAGLRELKKAWHDMFLIEEE